MFSTYTQRFPTHQLKQLIADLTVIVNTVKNLTATVQVLSDTLSGVSVSNATTPDLSPKFNTVMFSWRLVLFGYRW